MRVGVQIGVIMPKPMQRWPVFLHLRFHMSDDKYETVAKLTKQRSARAPILWSNGKAGNVLGGMGPIQDH